MPEKLSRKERKAAAQKRKEDLRAELLITLKVLTDAGSTAREAFREAAKTADGWIKSEPERADEFRAAFTSVIGDLRREVAKTEAQKTDTSS